jgi:chromosome partitioning protein
MTDPGERLRSSLAADTSASPVEFDTPIAMEAMRASRVLHAANQDPFPPPGRIRVITVANQKGGVGKTTSSVNLGVALALFGLRTLVIDLDPQGNTSTALGVEHTVGTPSIYDALVGDSTLGEVVHPTTASPNLRCVPATIDLAGAEIELVSVVAREHRLRRAIEAHLQTLPPEERPHYVLIDCPPSLGLLTLNALVAGDEVLIPIQCEYYALEGLGQLLSNIDLVRAHLNPGISVSTILLTMYDGRTKLADQVAEEVRNHFGDLVLTAVIPRNVRVSEAPGYGQSVLTYDPGSRGSTSYVEAARELAERGARLAPTAVETPPPAPTAAPPLPYATRDDVLRSAAARTPATTGHQEEQ